MAITTGRNTVKITGHRLSTSGIFDVITFILVNRKDEKHEISYATPAGGTPAKIVRDLIEIMQAKVWAVLDFRESNGLLLIVSIREPDIPQEELNSHVARVTLH